MGEIVKKVSLTGKKLKQSEYQEKGRLPVIDQGQSFIGGYTNKEKFKISCELPVIIFGDHTKVVKYVDFEFIAGADGVKVIKPLEVFYPKLFYYFLQAIQLPDKGYARHFQFLEKSSLPLPPLPEQYRIVAKIEEVFTKLDAGVEALKKVKVELKRYRQAVLKYAFEGKLTEEWRKANKGKIEPASELLMRIEEEREKDTKGKSSRPSLRRSKMTEAILKDEIASPSAHNDDLLELPVGWVWTRIEEISDLVSGQHILTGDYNFDSIGVPYLTGPADFGLKYPIISKWTTKPKAIAKKNDILITVKGAGVGKVNILHLEDAAISRQLMAVRGWYVNPSYVFFFVHFSFHLFQRLGAGSTVPGIDRDTIMNIPIPLPPLPEQHKIIEEIERRFSVADEVEKVVEQSLKQAERLRQSILKRAFEGKLVPQDPSDEPAEKLLERIKAEKAKLESNRKAKITKEKVL